MACAVFSLFVNGAAAAQLDPGPASGADAANASQALNAADATAAKPAITPADARRTADILRDDARRAALIRTLDTIAAAAPGMSGSVPAPTTGSAAPPAPAQPATAPDDKPATIVPLQSGGLVARMLRSLDRWMDSFTAQISEVAQAATEVPALLARSRAVATDAGQRLLGMLALALVVAFAAGLLLEWCLHRTLRRPRMALQEHANRQAMRQIVQREVAHASAEQAHQTPAAATAGAATDPAGDAAQAGLTPPAEGMAVIQTHRDGVDRVETVPVGKENAAGPIPAQAQTSTSAPPSPSISAPASASAPASTSAAASAQQADMDPQAAQTRQARDASWQQRPHHHWRTLRNMPYAIGALILEILPVALFFVVASLTLRYLAAGHPRIREAVGGFIAAYVALRLTMAIVRLLVSPAGQGLRLLDIGPATARVLMTWIGWIAGLALFGIAIADTIPLLGTSAALRMAFLKAISLLVHLSAVVLILKLRRPMRHALRAAPGAAGPLAVARNWLADAWVVIAIVLVMGVWVVWAMGVQDGFPKLIHFVLNSAAVLVVARLLAILLLGSLGRLFSVGRDAGHGDDAGEPGGAARLSERYYPWTRALVSVVLTLCTIVILFESWGVDALSWFASGSLGRSLASASLTIITAIIVAILVWEAAQYAVERRLARWTRQGDIVRAARLRTLLPMLRTALFVVVALIVGLTALNEIGINTTPLLAGASIIGVAVGFGSQKLVQDFITGIFLLMENAMRVGDWVTVAGVSGSVEYLSIRTVRLRGGDGALYIVPFSSVSTVSNSNRGIGNAAVRISVAYDTDIDRVVQELKRIGASLREDPGFKDQILNDIEVWGVDSVDGSMVTLVGQMRCSDKGRWGVQREINRRILERFRELGIEIANPRASLLVPSEPSPLAAPSAAQTTPAQGGARQGDGASHGSQA